MSSHLREGLITASDYFSSFIQLFGESGVEECFDEKIDLLPEQNLRQQLEMARKRWLREKEEEDQTDDEEDETDSTQKDIWV